MDPISSPELDSEAPSSGAPGQVVGPGGAVLRANSPALPPSPAPITDSPPVVPASDLTRPTAVAESMLPASSVILPPQAATFDAMSHNETAAAAKSPFIKKLAGKKIMLMAGLPLVVLGSSAAAYFGYVVPNQPDNIWAKALTNSGKAYDKLADYATTQSTSNKGVNLDASFKSTGQFIADGTFKGSSYGKDSEFTGSLSTNGFKAGLELRTLKSTGDTPDIYFKIDGLQGVSDLLGGDPALSGAINSVNGSWYFVDHTLLEQYAKEAEGTSSATSFTASDLKSVLDAIATASKQNVFTADPTKMAFVVKQKLGKQKTDGRNTYHFKVGIDGDNLGAYEKSLCTNLKNSSLKKFFNNSAVDTAEAFDCSHIDSAANSTKDTADVWVDTRTKLIHKIRFTDKSNSQNYFDVIQDYQGGDEIPFSLNYHNNDGGINTDFNLKMTLNMKTNKFNMSGETKESGDNPFGVSFNLSISPNTSKVKVVKPDNAKNVAQLVSDLGLDELFGGGGSFSLDGGGKAADTERKTDMNALHGQVEAYEAQNGAYPSLAQMNDAGWRAQNLHGLDSEALKDPDGSAASLSASPAAKVYSYQALPAGCNNSAVPCTDYTLTATLSDGSTYTKQALDNPASSSILN